MSRFFAKVKVLPKLQSSSTWVSSATGCNFRLMLKFFSRGRATGGSDQWRKNLCDFSILCNEAMFNVHFTASGMTCLWPGDAALFRVIFFFLSLNPWHANFLAAQTPLLIFTRQWRIERSHRLQSGLCLVRQPLPPPALHWCLHGPFLSCGDR